MHDPYVGEVPVRENTCHGPSALRGRVAGSFPHRLYLPSVSTWSLFAAGCAVSERPTLGSKCVSNIWSPAQRVSALTVTLHTLCVDYLFQSNNFIVFHCSVSWFDENEFFFKVGCIEEYLSWLSRSKQTSWVLQAGSNILSTSIGAGIRE